MADKSAIFRPGQNGAPQRPRLLEQVHEAIRRRYFSHRTEEAYVRRIAPATYFTGSL